MLDFVLSVFPVVLLVYLMTKRNSMPSNKALPLVALVLYLIKIIYFSADPNVINAEVINGLLKAWTPILIILGAIFLFRTMEASGAMDTIRTWLNSITDNPIAQLMIVGWAFAFMIEGASGFGTPAALAAPILVGLGFKRVSVAILCLVMNSVPVSFGAVGTPTWFGFSELILSPDEVQMIGIKSAIIHAFAALVIPIIALRLVVSWKDIRSNLFFIYLSIFACVIPYIVIAFFDYEFPALAGGMIGLVVSAMLAKVGVGLKKAPVSDSLDNPPLTENKTPSFGAIIKASFPLWGTVLVLVVTRIEQIGIKPLLITPKAPKEEIAQHTLEFSLGTLGTGSINKWAVVGLNDIFGTDVSWNHAIIYVPSLVPFILISVIAFALFTVGFSKIKKVCMDTGSQMRNPILALLGALVFVRLLMTGGDESCVMIIGNSLADWMGGNWVFAAAPLGAVGSFFSGSATISNLTFGGIQDSIAGRVGLDRTTILALQSAGGAMGNMVCINNIVAVCSVLGLTSQEGYILKRTVWALLAYIIIAGLVGLFM